MSRHASRRIIAPFLAGTFVWALLYSACEADSQAPDRWRAAFGADSQQAGRTLHLPVNSSGPPAAGKRVAVTTPEYSGTKVHHMLYLPPDWRSDWKKRRMNWPVIVEYTGNYYPAAGSTGEVADAALGYGLSGGHFIWVTLPFVGADHLKNAVRWWGDEEATVEYAKMNVPRICQAFGGDSRAVFICGFSRGAIATNYIGLHDDEIAQLWCGLITHDHYDGVKEWRGTTWGTPLTLYRSTATQRLRRLHNRSTLICQNGGTAQVATYLRSRISLRQFTFVDLDTNKILGKFPNEWAVHPHTDRWLVRDSPQRRQVWGWILRTLLNTNRGSRPPTSAGRDASEGQTQR